MTPDRRPPPYCSRCSKPIEGARAPGHARLLDADTDTPGPWVCGFCATTAEEAAWLKHRIRHR